MNVLVTGSNGFIGGHVCKYIMDNGEHVIGLDLHDDKKKPCDKYIKCNLAYDDLNGVLGEDEIDAVVHLASDMRHEPYAVEVVTNNCRGAEKLLEFCEENKISSFVQLSSLPVIGYPREVPITEEHSLRPPTVYHVTKFTQELLANYAYYTFGLRTVSFRICSPVGEGVNPKTIFPTFVRKAVNNEDITLIGKGTRKQTYIHVKDIAQAIYKAIKTETAQGVYNLASYNLISNYDLAKKIVELTDSKSKIIFLNKLDPMDEHVWDISIDKLKKEIGYEPTVNIDEAILEFAEIIKKEG